MWKELKTLYIIFPILHIQVNKFDGFQVLECSSGLTRSDSNKWENGGTVSWSFKTTKKVKKNYFK